MEETSNAFTGYKTCFQSKQAAQLLPQETGLKNT
jgi:hypothetical protein